MQSKLNIFLFLSLTILFSCSPPDPNQDATGHNEFETLQVDEPIDQSRMNFHDVLYVPIYSDVYIDVQNQKSLIAATLSIRNTSLTDTLYVSKIDYYNTKGELVREFLTTPISLTSMGTVNYVIEKEDDTGGSGANFIVELSASNPDVRPLVQALMIGVNGNIAFSFLTDGYSIK